MYTMILEANGLKKKIRTKELPDWYNVYLSMPITWPYKTFTAKLSEARKMQTTPVLKFRRYKQISKYTFTYRLVDVEIIK